MSNSESVGSNPAENAGVLKTVFVTQEQTAMLTKIVELSFEQLDSVGGGLASVETEQCCSCCHKPPAT